MVANGQGNGTFESWKIIVLNHEDLIGAHRYFSYLFGNKNISID